MHDGTDRCSYSLPPLSEQDMSAWREENRVLDFCVGLNTEGQQPGSEREVCFVERSANSDSKYPLISCIKGMKGDGSPNQDNFSFMHLEDGYSVGCCFDGHGPEGHEVAARTVKTLPHYLINSLRYPNDIKGALWEAYASTQEDLNTFARTEGINVQGSGSTAVTVVWKGDTVWVANLGDSKCVIGYEKPKRLHYETKDHVPEDQVEEARIRACGGEVRSQTYSDGFRVHRVFLKGKDFPGLAMSRTFGDQCVKSKGVISEPDVDEIKVDLNEKPFMLLASDGVWEFMASDFVVKAVATALRVDGSLGTLKKVTKEAQKRWKENEGNYCDDITSMLIQFH